MLETFTQNWSVKKNVLKPKMNKILKILSISLLTIFKLFNIPANTY